jgi:hypothetical protein
MAQRRIGPTLGAGVVVLERDSARLIDPAPLGVTVYVTPTAKGSITKLNSSYSKREFYRKLGNRIGGFDGPDCGYDFWDHSVGKGELHVVRVAASGQLRSAIVDVWSRELTTNVDGFASTDGKARPVLRVTAASGGRWAGRRRAIHREVTVIGNIGVTTVTTGLTMLQDEWVGGVVALDGVSTKTYTITGNTTAGVVSVSSDSNMTSDIGGGTDKGYTLIMNTEVGPDGNNRTLGVLISDGETNPATEFGLSVFVDEALVKRWANLSMDPASKNYFVRIINDDQSNYDITVTDLLSPANPVPTDRRPANAQGVITAISATTLTIKPFQVRRLVGASNPTFALVGDTDLMKYPDTIEFICTSVSLGNATFTATSNRLNGAVSIIAAPVTSTNTAATVFTFTSTDPNLPNFTMTCGSTIFTATDKFQLDYMPLEPNALVNGNLCPDFVNKPAARFRITGNTHNVITVQTGDLTTDGAGAVGDRWMAFWPMRNNWTDTLTTLTAANGYDALAALSDNDYLTTALNPLASPARRLLVENKGLVKVACPDHPTTAVTKQLLAFAEALNWQGRIEIPDTVLAESDAVDYINNTIGRSDFGVVTWPSYGDVLDPEKSGQLKRTPLTGMINGREALVANQFQGYHKAAAGLDVVLPKVVQLPTGDLIFNEEITNPQGVNVVKRVKGNMILWGDRTICLDPTWKFKHQREQMSHYENRLREGFDYIIFSINNKRTWAQLLVTLKAFFLPEFAKGALSGDKPDQAFAIKIDAENNTPLDAANGDLNCDITLKLADTVERFNISIGKAGIFDSVSN